MHWAWITVAVCVRGCKRFVPPEQPVAGLDMCWGSSREAIQKMRVQTVLFEFSQDKRHILEARWLDRN